MDFNSFIDISSNAHLKHEGEYLIASEKIKFPIKNSIPRFNSSDNYAEAFGLQWNTFKNTLLDSYTKSDYAESRLETALGQSLSSIQGLKVLEAGSGSGMFTEILLKYGAKVYSFDFSNAVDANYDNNMPNEDLTLFQADIRNIPFPDEFFDLSICLGVLQHTPNTLDSMIELTRVLKTDGKLVVDHYKHHIGHFASLYLVWWLIIKSLNPLVQIKITTALTKIFFPIHWFFRDYKLIQFALRRVSPISFYYKIFPYLSKELQYEWSLCDTHDKNTDQYKRHYTTKQFNRLVELNFKFQSYEINERGNGLECIAIK
ncbi:class I SAM-dependent methyltransferase [bacterium]|jgi:ubiquinone/menaquinone biosynthesis C-methylase UbiE|nr:class I SAM-dependent methyltransferase [bacterium]|tara:strand:- start:2336 stop:3283 length:948 start_codon:yes stop_codon:yes gene_type:complete